MRTLAAIFLLLMPVPALAQPEIDTLYRVEVTATASPMVNLFRSPRVPGDVTNATFGYGGSIRVMWHPSRLLAFGLFTGSFALAKDDLVVEDDAVRHASYRYHAELSAIPIQMALSMQKHGTEVGMAIGPYIMRSSIFGGPAPPVEGTRLELGMTFFGSHVFTIADRWSLGPELRIVYFRYRGILCVMPSFSMRYDLVRY